MYLTWGTLYNVSGTCVKTKHYMVDTTNKINEIIELIEYEDYFVINRPRQYGKTTTLELLYQALKDKYLVIDLSFGKVSQEAYENTNSFAKEFYRNVKRVLVRNGETELVEILEDLKIITTFGEFSDIITNFIIASKKSVILFIDEADDGTNNEVFIKFLATLRDKYLARNTGKDNTFKSVILAGVQGLPQQPFIDKENKRGYDIKNLKYKIRNQVDSKYNSPWNIAAKFTIDMSFNADEIETMLFDYNSEHNDLIVDTKFIANRIHHFIA